MNGYCYHCKQRFLGNCDAYDRTYENKIIKPYQCPEYGQVLVKHVIKPGKEYFMINDSTHTSIGNFTYEEALKNFGECEWRGAYTTGTNTLDMWIWKGEY